MRSATAILPLALLALLTACGGQQAVTPVATPQPSTSGPVCATAHIPPTGTLFAAADVVRLPEDFVATAVVECVIESRPVAGDGVWTFLVEKRATAKVDAFVTALRRPDEGEAVGVRCNAIGYAVDWFALVDASGRVAHATIPADGCRQPQAEGRAAMQALPFVEVSATKRDRVQTEAEWKADAAANAVGCSTPFKDMIAEEDADRPAGSPPPGPILGPSASGVTLCRYAAVKDTDGSPLLTFRSGEKLSRASSAAVVAALDESGPEQPCTVAHTAVVGVFTEQNGWALVEADGCHRVHGADSRSWGQATADLLALLR
jgi:hypothetical protein